MVNTDSKKRMGMVEIRLPRVVFMSFLLASLLPWVIVVYLANRTGRPGAAATEAAVDVRLHHEILDGPWGLLDVEPIILDYPSSLAIFDFNAQPYRNWTFRHSTRDDIRQRLTRGGLDEAVCAALLQTAVAEDAIKGFVLHPPDAIVRGFTPRQRADLYAEFARNPEEPVQARPFMFRGGTVSEWFFHSGVRAETVGQIDRLAYRRGNYLFFSDPQLIVSSVTSRLERVRLYRALHRSSALRMRLCVKEGESPAEVLAYWSHAGRDADIEPLMTTLATQNDGLSILYMLPAFARTRLYTYPPPQTGESSVVHDCHWASLNFFNAEPDDSRSGLTIGRILTQEYERVQIPTQFGDMVLLFVGDRLVHSCIYLAGDIVFTKNGIGSGDPFVLEKLDDVAGLYRAIYGDIRLGFCRRKGT